MLPCSTVFQETISYQGTILYGPYNIAIALKDRMLVMNSKNPLESVGSAQLLEIRGCTFVAAENVPFSWYGGTCGTFVIDEIETLLARVIKSNIRFIPYILRTARIRRSGPKHRNIDLMTLPQACFSYADHYNSNSYPKSNECMMYDGVKFTALLNGKNTVQSNSYHDHAFMGNYKGYPFIVGGRHHKGIRDQITVRSSV